MGVFAGDYLAGILLEGVRREVREESKLQTRRGPADQSRVLPLLSFFFIFFSSFLSYRSHDSGQPIIVEGSKLGCLARESVVCMSLREGPVGELAFRQASSVLAS